MCFIHLHVLIYICNCTSLCMYILHISTLDECNFSPEPSATYTQEFYFWRMAEHDAAIQLNLAPSRHEVKRWNNKQHPVTFQNKTHRVDTSAQISRKRQTQALLLIPRSGTLCVVVFNNRPVTVVASDYVIIAETPRPCDASCLQYCTIADSNRNRWGLPGGRRLRKKSDRGHKQRTHIQWKLRLRQLDCFQFLQDVSSLIQEASSV